jgi:predicted small secreted protein
MKTLALLGVIGCALALSACNTVRGVGEDVATTGVIVQQAATPAYYYY